MATAEEVFVRPCRPREEEYLMDFSEKIEWDFSMYDFNSYMRHDPDFQLVAVDKSGTPVGFVGLSKQGPNVVYFGNFIVREDLRGRGIGRLLWKASVEKTRNCNIVLDGMSKMAEWYKTHGFQHQSYKVFFYKVDITDEMKKKTESKFNVLDLTEDLWPELMAYDRLVYPNFDREKVLRAWFTGTNEVRVVIAKDAGKVVGYGSIHKKPKGEYGLRNVFADNEAVIEALLRNMFADLPLRAVVNFILVEGKPLPSYIKHSVKIPETAERMYSKEVIQTNTDRMWFATVHIV